MEIEKKPTDLPRDQLMAEAQRILDAHPDGRALIYFKFWCEKCGERCSFEEPNTLFAKGECFKCGHLTEVTEGGYMIMFSMGKGNGQSGS